MRRSVAGLLGLVGFVALLVAALLWVIPSIEKSLTERAGDELAASGIDDATVSFDGRDGKIEGVEAAEAEARLDSLPGARWVRAEPGPTTTTTIEVTTTTEPERASLTMARTGSVVNLSGSVPSDAQKQAIITEVERAGFDVEDNLQVDPAMVGDDAKAVLPIVRPLLDGAEDGVLDLSDGSVIVSATAADPVEAEEIESALAKAEDRGLAVERNIGIVELSEDQQIVALQDEIDQIFQLAREIEGKSPAFGTSDDELNQPAKDVLDRVIVAMRRYPLPAAEVIGHTDSNGSAVLNQTLSEQRAATVAGYLTQNGVGAERLTTAGRGESEPVADNTTEEGRATNRRVNFIVKKSEQ